MTISQQDIDHLAAEVSSLAIRLDALRTRVNVLECHPADAIGGVSGATESQVIISRALHTAWTLGQAYAQQIDSKSTFKQDKAATTRQQFLALIDEACVLIGAQVAVQKA